MNHVTISGNLTADPEARTTKSEKSMATFRVAVNSGKDRDAEYFNVVCFDQTAENVLKYVGKGRAVAITGRLSQRSWTDDEDKKHSKVEIVASQMFFGPLRQSGESDPVESPIEEELVVL